MKTRLKQILNYSLYDLLTYPRKRKIQLECQRSTDRIISHYLKSNAEKKLQVGCGTNFLDGWLNTDLCWNENIAFLDAGQKFPFQNETFHFVFSEHLFEHLSFQDQLSFLKESLRVLKTGGILRIATPDLKFLTNLYVGKEKDCSKDYCSWAIDHSGNLRKIKRELLDINFPAPYVINNFFHAWGHQQIHDVDSLKELGLKVGFDSVVVQEPGRSDYSSLKNIERHGEIIGEERNRLETMVLELKK